MCDNLLCDVFTNKIELEIFLAWLSYQKNSNYEFIDNFGCTQNDFITYILNYISDELKIDRNKEVLQKRTIQVESVSSKIECEESLAKLSVTDTPKRSNNLNQSYTSPLSPLYDKQNFSTPKSNTRTTPRTTPCLGDFLITSSSKKKARKSDLVKSDEKNKSRIRRINPTNLVSKRFQQDENSFTFNNDETICNCNDSTNVPLAEELSIISNRRNSNENNLLVKSVLNTTRTEILPDFENVTFKQSLDILVSIYNCLIDNNFILNLACEIYFLISVLLEKNYSQSENESSFKQNLRHSDTILFKTIHNRVYFAANVLQAQTKVFKFLDKFTLNLFIENNRVKQFVSDSFLTGLVKIRDEKQEKCFSLYSNSLPTSVCFNLDTDNRDNFPTSMSFQAFCKQRDMFCEILRIWEQNHLDIRWDASIGLSGKIKALLQVHSDSANLVHLARLFKAKLMVNLNKTEESTALFSNVKSETMSQLNNRIAPKQSGCGINSVPSFVGYEEFYHIFLNIASNQSFNRHVIDAFSCEIANLTSSKFILTDSDCIESFTNTSLKQSYIICIKSSSVLAKFLGFLESQPYKCDSAHMTQTVINCQVNIRSQFHPSINLKEILNNCVKNNCLLLIIPWLVNYIAMLDCVTVRLPYFKEVFYTLFNIYYNAVTDQNENIDESALLIKLSLGWLFDLSHFPKEMYYQWLFQKLNSHNNLRNDKKTFVGKLINGVHLDNSQVVDSNILYTCCPYLNEIKTILINNSSKMCNSSTVKYATLLSATKLSPDLANIRLQNQLQEAFFNGQPTSIRKTVEFVSERIASTCVKDIFNEIVPSYKKIALENLKKSLSSFTVAGLEGEKYSNALAEINEKTRKCAISSMNELQDRINNETNSIMDMCIKPIINNLLIKELTNVKDVCMKISTQMCRERIQQWRDSNLSTNIFIKDFEAEVKNLLQNTGKADAEKTLFMLPTFGKTLAHNPAALGGFEIIDLIRTFNLDVISKPNTITKDQLTNLLCAADQSIKERCDINECIILSINTLLVDTLVVLIAYQPTLVQHDILQKACCIWEENNYKSKNIFKSIISSRNLMFFKAATDMSWHLFRNFIIILLKDKFLTFEIFEKQILNVCKNFQHAATKRCFVNFMLSIVNYFNGDYEFTLLKGVLHS